MDIFDAIALVLLGYIAYQWYEKNRLLGKGVANNKHMRGTFSAAFSEAAIEQQQQKEEQIQQTVSDRFDNVIELEQKEIIQHSRKGGNVNNFDPSKELLMAIALYEVALNDRESEGWQASRMIEANAAVLNGKNIKEAQEDMWKQHPILGTNSTALRQNKQVSKSVLEQRKSYWKSSWDSIVAD